MKTNFLKSLFFMILGAALAYTTASLSNSKEKKTNEPTVVEQKTNVTTESNNTVPLEIAAKDIAFYRLWLKYVPNTIELVDSTLKFGNVKIKPEDFNLVSCTIDSVKKNLNIEGNVIPFSPASSKAYAYLIKKDDIQDAWNNVDDPESVTGIRIYTAPSNLASNDSSKVSTHVYVVATVTEENNDYIPGGDNKYVYDLTAPCPAACGDKNELNDFSLNCSNFQ